MNIQRQFWHCYIFSNFGLAFWYCQQNFIFQCCAKYMLAAVSIYLSKLLYCSFLLSGIITIKTICHLSPNFILKFLHVWYFKYFRTSLLEYYKWKQVPSLLIVIYLLFIGNSASAFFLYKHLRQIAIITICLTNCNT